MYHNLRKGGYTSYFKFHTEGQVTAELNSDGHAYVISGAPVVEIISKSDEGEILEGHIPAQRRAIIRFGHLIANRCNPTLEVNPELYAKADVFFQRIYDDHSEIQDVEIFISSKAKIDLTEYAYLVKIYAAV